jgi:hypothetical protein
VSDMLEAIHANSALAFLREDFPALPPKPKPVKALKTAPAPVAPLSNKASITSFFSKSKGSESSTKCVENDSGDVEGGSSPVEEMDE